MGVVDIFKMAASLQPEDITRIAEDIQRRFVEEHRDDDLIDHRDYKRVKTCLPYVCKFVRQKFGDYEAAYEMLVDAQKWRKLFGVQDLSFDQVDTVYFQTGVGIPHGDDRDGCSLVILNCHLHKKDAKKFPQLQKFFIFCLESHARRFPDKKMTMLFNMSECGISNMDMEFVRFIVNCFKFYFPDMLSKKRVIETYYLLVFEMPWVLQAAWRIIKGWLGEAAIRKIKFVTKSDITDYVSPDQLLVKFGGTDTWVYEYNPVEMRQIAEGVWQRDPLIIEETESEGEGLEEEESEDSLKQVRFAPGQPPSRQSRYGSQDDVDTPTPLPDGQLRRGTASSPGYRRRQVSRLMNLQRGGSTEQPTRSLPTILEDGNRRSSHSHQIHSSNIILRINPIDELLFRGPSGQELLCNVVLTNTTDAIVAYKIKTTAPNRYKVRPNINLVGGAESADIQVKLLTGSNDMISQDKFLVQAYQFPAGATPPDPTQLPNFWKSLARDKSVEEYRLKCRYVHENPAQPVSNSGKRNDAAMIASLNVKVDQLIATVTKLQNTLNRLWYICIALLLLLIVIDVLV